VALLALLFALQVLSGNAWHQAHPIRSDLITGLFVASLLGRIPSGVRRFLETRLLCWLGGISYSLYLIHYPLLSLCHAWQLARLPALSPGGQLGLLFLTGVPISIVAGWTLHRCVEAPLYRYVKRAI
jgi:peptidoglycan/LPS O-acetylase OafA/YrhL